MKCKAILISLSVLVAGCAPATDSACAAWRMIPLAEGTPEWLDTNDRRALAGVVGHNETGADRCGWGR